MNPQPPDPDQPRQKIVVELAPIVIDDQAIMRSPAVADVDRIVARLLDAVGSEEAEAVANAIADAFLAGVRAATVEIVAQLQERGVEMPLTQTWPDEDQGPEEPTPG